MNRKLFLAAAILLAGTTVAPFSTHAGLLGKLGLGGPVYESFSGKFFDSKTVANAHNNEAATETTMLSFGKTGHSLGAPTSHSRFSGAERPATARRALPAAFSVRAKAPAAAL